MYKFDKVLQKKAKEGKEMSGNEKEAKMSVVQALRDFAAGEMSKKMDGLKKVSVASDSKEGLEKGLDKAKEMIGSKPERDEAGEDQYDETEESDQEQKSEAERGVDQHPAEFADTPHGDYANGDESDSNEEMSEDDINEKLAHLMSLKQKLKK